MTNPNIKSRADFLTLIINKPQRSQRKNQRAQNNIFIPISGIIPNNSWNVFDYWTSRLAGLVL